MSKGYAQNQQRKDDLNRFAKDLVRRAKSSCELCEATDVRLEVFEVPPAPDEPEIDRCFLICETCQQYYQKPKLMDPSHFQVLNRTVWSDIPAVQVTAVRILRRLVNEADWAQDLLGQIYLDPEVEVWIDQAE